MFASGATVRYSPSTPPGAGIQQLPGEAGTPADCRRESPARPGSWRMVIGASACGRLRNRRFRSLQRRAAPACRPASGAAQRRRRCARCALRSSALSPPPARIHEEMAPRSQWPCAQFRRTSERRMRECPCWKVLDHATDSFMNASRAWTQSGSVLRDYREVRCLAVRRSSTFGEDLAQLRPIR